MILQSLTPLAEPTATGVLLRVLLCSVYLWSAGTKLLKFNATAAHFSSTFHLPAPQAAVALAIGVQFAGAAMIISGYKAWLAAMMLAAFSVAATIIADQFWKMTGEERSRTIEAFLKNLGLAAAFLLVAWPAAS